MYVYFFTHVMILVSVESVNQMPCDGLNPQAGGPADEMPLSPVHQQQQSCAESESARDKPR